MFQPVECYLASGGKQPVIISALGKFVWEAILTLKDPGNIITK